MPTATTTPDAVPMHQFVCAEVRGGNWPVNTAIATPGLKGWMRSIPSDGDRGGDVHYVTVCGSGLLSRVCLADVAGHGETVSAVSQRLQKELRRQMNTLDQRRVLRKLNQQLLADHFETFATAALLTYYPPSRRASISYAGHPPAWVKRKSEPRWTPIIAADGEVATEPSQTHAKPGLRNLPIGVSAETEFTRVTLSMEMGDRLLMLTDGVLEAPGSGGAMFGEGGFQEFLAANPRLSPRELVDALFDEVYRWTGGVRHDDLSLIVVEIVPGPAGPAVWTVVKNRLFLRPLGLA